MTTLPPLRSVGRAVLGGTAARVTDRVRPPQVRGATLVLSPHFDDAPLSLGQSMLDGELAHLPVVVGVVFGRTNWQHWFHPTRGRARVVSAIRRGEEARAARRFGYGVVTAGLEEVILRRGDADPAGYLDTTAPLDPGEVDAVAAVIRDWMAPATRVLAPAGVGGHLDHRLVAAAAQRVGHPSLAFYEDRPYAGWLADDEIARQVRQLDTRLRPRPVSPTISARKWETLWFPSQFDERFADALHDDVRRQRCERVWEPPVG
jgi:LmbE family N-acetylglucosaminyl deacetylase